MVGDVIVLAVDPGRNKSGIAVCAPGRTLLREIVETPSLVDRVRAIASAYKPGAIVIGARSVGARLGAALAGLEAPIVLVDESGTTLQARARYWLEHPPRGLLRLLPPGLRVPREAYDDYVAVLLAERYLAAASGHRRAEEHRQ